MQKDLDRLWEWADGNEMKINPSKCKGVRLTKASVKDALDYKFRNQLLPEENSGKYLGIILHSDLRWTNHIIYRMNKSWKALHLIMRILK